MARKSRKNIASRQGGQENKAVSLPKGRCEFTVGIYARLSVLDSGNPGSEAMENQLRLLKNYVAQEDTLNLAAVYCDNGVSGTNFERPDFERMLLDIGAGKINCIVVKDFSRLGRNFLEAGNLLERVFPERGIRFISILDQFDSLKDGYPSILIGVKNLINEFYARDVSQKALASLRVKQREGKYLSGRAPYGYLRDQGDKYRLRIDLETAPIVKKIFEEKAAGKSCSAIARELNEQGILTPERYRYQKGLIPSCRNKDGLWGDKTVQYILKNPVYCGKLAYGKTEKRNFKEKRGTLQEESNWRIVAADHEAIVSETIFLQGREQLSAGKKKKTRENGRG